jgi:hypothetical protein
MTTTITPMKSWMDAATPEEQEMLARTVHSSRGALYQYSGGHRQCSAERAIQIELATADMHKASKGRLPRLYRTDLASACRGCDFARRCLGEAITVRSEFPIVTAVTDSEGGEHD